MYRQQFQFVNGVCRTAQSHLHEPLWDTTRKMLAAPASGVDQNSTHTSSFFLFAFACPIREDYEGVEEDGVYVNSMGL